MAENMLTSEQLQAFSDLLEARKSELQLQLRQLESSTEPVTLDQQSVGRVSRIDAIQQQQMAIASKTQVTQILQRIETALQRIKQATYGDCLRCGEPISTARLEVQPEATLCLVCQSDSEGR